MPFTYPNCSRWGTLHLELFFPFSPKIPFLKWRNWGLEKVSNFNFSPSHTYHKPRLASNWSSWSIPDLSSSQNPPAAQNALDPKERTQQEALGGVAKYMPSSECGLDLEGEGGTQGPAPEDLSHAEEKANHGLRFQVAPWGILGGPNFTVSQSYDNSHY
jgi:hypothetical protein